ncbi:DUF4861 domain-containing protein [Paludibacter sp. 221]|uniref:DUF4861 family protein n=1 Tax=Paludibacter sp. 221 TaxID=2302939 RepID=UPI0013D759B5|nr:DUF4861 family protein [Paludibacter sp. 221]NDV45868.1 DUF4861 domain-containing protein [Paludibacter sp. 221]
MKKLIFSFLAVILLVSCSSEPRTIVVNNFAEFDRTGEIVEVKTSVLNCNFNKKSYILKDEGGNEIDYQLLSDKQTLLFQADVKASSKSNYTLTEGTPKQAKALVYARYISERKDDFAWENNFAAYRMYGPALANENPSNGVDLWLKRTDELIVDKFYHDELKKGLSYHIDHGLGLDCYKVGHTLGAGGVALYTDKLWVGDHYSQQEVIENGPLRAIFKLTYDSVKVDSNYYKQTIKITVDAGSILNKAEVTYEGNEMPLKIAGGIFLHDGKGVEFIDTENNVIGYAENAVSDAGIPSGRNYVGVFMPGKVETEKEPNHLLILSDYQQGYEFTYYFGGGWSKWGFATDDDWFDALLHFSKVTASPLSISFR